MKLIKRMSEMIEQDLGMKKKAETVEQKALKELEEEEVILTTLANNLEHLLITYEKDIFELTADLMKLDESNPGTPFSLNEEYASLEKKFDQIKEKLEKVTKLKEYIQNNIEEA